MTDRDGTRAIHHPQSGAEGYLPRLHTLIICVVLMLRSSEISLIQAPISPGFSLAPEKNPVKPSISVRVENTPNYRPGWQNTVDLHLT